MQFRQFKSVQFLSSTQIYITYHIELAMENNEYKENEMRWWNFMLP